MMNTHQNYTLASRPQTNRVLRGWAVLSRGTFSGAIFLTDVALIVAMSTLTGIAYHLVAYGDAGNVSSYVQVGLLAASIFAISNLFRREYRLPNFFSFKPHGRRTIQLWNVTLVCLLMLGFLAQISVDYSRGWILLFYVTTLIALMVERYVIVRVTALARAAGLLSALRIFLIGTGANVGAFVSKYEPWTLGINIVGCRFRRRSLRPPRSRSDAPFSIATLPRRSPASASSSPTPSSCCCHGRPPRRSIVAPRPSSRCQSRFISVPSVCCTIRRGDAVDAWSGRELAADTAAADAPRNHPETHYRSGVRRRRAASGNAAPGAGRRADQARQPGADFLRARRFGFNQQPFRIIKFRTMRTLDDGAVIQQAHSMIRG